MEVKIPFKKEMRDAIKTGKKECTARSRKYGDAGDTFFVDRVKYKIIGVGKVTLKCISNIHFSCEGFSSPEEFKKYMIDKIGVKWDDEREMYLHYFLRLKD